MRALFHFMVVGIVCVCAVSAHADTDVVVLGPAASGKVSAATLDVVKTRLRRSGIGPAVDRPINALCAADLSCLVKAGKDLSAQRVLAVTVAQTGKGQLTIGFSLVDVIGNEMVAVRDVAMADKKISTELVGALKKFLDEAPTDRAKALFAEGNQHFNLNELDQALELYKRAYRIRPLPAFLFNMAQCHRKLGHYQEAVNMYQAYLVGVPDASNKDMVQSLIDESKKLLAEQLKRDQDKAALAADVERKRLDTARRNAEDTRKAKEAEAVAEANRQQAEQARIAHEKTVYNTHPIRKWVIATSILSAGAIGAGSYFGVQAHKQQRAFDASFCGDPTRSLDATQLATCASERSAGGRDALLSNALIIGGAAGILGSILLFALDPGNVSSPEAPRAAIRVAPTSVHLVLTW